MSARDIYASVNTEALTFAEECYTARIFSKIMVLKCPFKAIKYNSKGYHSKAWERLNSIVISLGRYSTNYMQQSPSLKANISSAS
jgi:hypothetical protein